MLLSKSSSEAFTYPEKKNLENCHSGKSVWTEDISRPIIMNTNYIKYGCMMGTYVGLSTTLKPSGLSKYASYGSPHRINLQVAGLMLGESMRDNFD